MGGQGQVECLLSGQQGCLLLQETELQQGWRLCRILAHQPAEQLELQELQVPLGQGRQQAVH